MLSSTVLRRSAAALTAKKAASPGMSVAFDGIARRFKSDDAGDVIGIDLGTTNSCVSIMVRNKIIILLEEQTSLELSTRLEIDSSHRQIWGFPISGVGSRSWNPESLSWKKPNQINPMEYGKGQRGIDFWSGSRWIWWKHLESFHFAESNDSRKCIFLVECDGEEFETTPSKQSKKWL